MEDSIETCYSRSWEKKFRYVQVHGFRDQLFALFCADIPLSLECFTENLIVGCAGISEAAISSSSARCGCWAKFGVLSSFQGCEGNFFRRINPLGYVLTDVPYFSSVFYQLWSGITPVTIFNFFLPILITELSFFQVLGSQSYFCNNLLHCRVGLMCRDCLDIGRWCASLWIGSSHADFLLFVTVCDCVTSSCRAQCLVAFSAH